MDIVQRDAVEFPWRALALSYVRDDLSATDVRLIVSIMASQPNQVRLRNLSFELPNIGIENLCDVFFKQT